MIVCLFDIDGTLLNSGGAGQAAMEAAFVEQFGPMQPVEGVAYAGRTDRAIIADIFRYFDIEDDDHTRDEFVGRYFSHLPDKLSQKEGGVLPGVTVLLEELASRENVELGLLTGNFRRGAEIKLGHFDLFHHFEFGGFGDIHHDRGDVARDALQETRAFLNRDIHPSQIWVIGDTPADVSCARVIDANVIAVSTGHFSEETLAATKPDHLLPDFSDPQAILELLAL